MPGLVAEGTAVSFIKGGGTVYYTTDGSDPRLPGGAVSGRARTATPVIVNASTVITARAQNGSDWSGPIHATYLVGSLANASNLIISELHYAPESPATPGEQAVSLVPADYEFIELKNISPTDRISLIDVHFEQGIDFVFTGSAITSLGPGERVLIVSNQAVFEARYGLAHSSRIAGEFQNGTHLDNDGETIRLVDGLGVDIARFTYNDQIPWPFDAGFTGYSLVLINGAALPGAYDNPAQWRTSTHLGGNPNAGDDVPFVGNELDDLDNDHLAALLEYALGTSDSDSGSGAGAFRIDLAELEIAGVIDTYLIATHRRQLAADEALIRIEETYDLDGDWTTAGLILHSEVHNGDGTSTVTYRGERPVSPAERRVFFRVTAQAR